MALGEISLADVLDDGMVTVYRVDYEKGEIELQCKEPVVLGTYAANPELVAAVKAWPAHYRAGAVGPDAYPDMLTGQAVIHPDSKAWLQHIWDSAHALPAGTTKRQKALAFVVGYLTHASGDMYVHTFVNYFAGGPFEIGYNMARHFRVEGYIAEKGPKPKSWVIRIGGLKEFIHDTFLDPTSQTVAKRLEAGNPWFSLPAKLGVLRRYLQAAYVDWYYTQKAAYEEAVEGAQGVDWARSEAARLLFIGRWGPIIGYVEAWIEDIDLCLQEWPGFGHQIARGLFMNPAGPQVPEARLIAKRFAVDYLLSALGVPDFVGGIEGLEMSLEQFVARILELFHITWLDALKQDLLNWLVFAATEYDTVEEWAEAVSETAGALAFEAAMLLPGTDESVKGMSAKEFEVVHLKLPGDGPWDYRKFQPAYNTVTIGKLLFLSEASLAELACDLGYASSDLGGPNAQNVALGFLQSLDGDNRWWQDDPPRMVLAQDFCLYRKIFMQQTGEDTSWQTFCPAENECLDGIDNDSDGAPDCADSDCAVSCACTGPPNGAGGEEAPEGAPVCGDGDCGDEESCELCVNDCGACPSCPHTPCEAGVALDPACGECPAVVCALDPYCCTVAWDGMCVLQTSIVCPGGEVCPPTCGDGIQQQDETCESCPADCSPAICGNGLCEGAECAAGACAADCPEGCPPCGHDLCVTASPPNASCDPCATAICAEDPFCCTVHWDTLCVDAVETICGGSCPPACGDFLCETESGETCASCPRDCGACVGECGDGACDWHEHCASCPEDCDECDSPPPPPTAVCGDGICTATLEDCQGCSVDCGPCKTLCGDGICEEGENCSKCPFDGGSTGCYCPNPDTKWCETTGTCAWAQQCPTGTFYLGGCECCLTYNPFPLACTYCMNKNEVFWKFCPDG